MGFHSYLALQTIKWAELIRSLCPIMWLLCNYVSYLWHSYPTLNPALQISVIPQSPSFKPGCLWLNYQSRFYLLTLMFQSMTEALTWNTYPIRYIQHLKSPEFHINQHLWYAVFIRMFIKLPLALWFWVFIPQMWFTTFSLLQSIFLPQQNWLASDVG